MTSKLVKNLAVQRLEEQQTRLYHEIDIYKLAMDALVKNDEAVTLFAIKIAATRFQIGKLQMQVTELEKGHEGLDYYYVFDHYRLTDVNTLTARYSAKPDGNGEYHSIVTLWEHRNNVLTGEEIAHRTARDLIMAREWCKEDSYAVVVQYDPDWVEEEEFDETEWEREQSRHLWG